MNIEEVIQEKNLQECTEELPEMPEDHMPRPVKKKKRGKGRRRHVVPCRLLPDRAFGDGEPLYHGI